jgi:hypothetical protein
MQDKDRLSFSQIWARGHLMMCPKGDIESLRNWIIINAFIRMKWRTRVRNATRDKSWVQTEIKSSLILPLLLSTPDLTPTKTREYQLTRARCFTGPTLRESLTTWVNTEFQGHLNQTGRAICMDKIRVMIDQEEPRYSHKQQLNKVKGSRIFRSLKRGHRWLFNSC